MKLFIGTGDVTDLRYLFQNVVADGTQPETAGPNDINVSAAFEDSGASVNIPMQFNGAVKGLITPGARMLTDSAGIDLAGMSTGFVRTGIDVAAAAHWPRTAFFVSTGLGDYQVEGPAATTQVFSTGSLTVPGSGGTAAAGFLPTCILGYTQKYTPAVAIIGDSIAAGTIGDTSDTVNASRGIIARGLWATDNSWVIPHTMMCRASERAFWLQGFNGTRRKSLLEYHTHAIIDYVTNDIVAGSSAANIEAYLSNIWQACKRRGLQVWQMLCLPRTTYPGNVPAANFDSGGIRDQVNTWIVSQVGQGLLDGYIDPNPILESQTTHGTWANIGTDTADGTHPNNVGAVKAAAAFRAVAQTF